MENRSPMAEFHTISTEHNSGSAQIVKHLIPNFQNVEFGKKVKRLVLFMQGGKNNSEKIIFRKNIFFALLVRSSEVLPECFSAHFYGELAWNSCNFASPCANLSMFFILQCEF